MQCPGLQNRIYEPGVQCLGSGTHLGCYRPTVRGLSAAADYGLCMLTRLGVGLVGFSLWSSALAIPQTLPLSAQVEDVCILDHIDDALLRLKCTKGAAAPVDPRLVPGVPLGAWRLMQSRPTPESGAALFEYRRQDESSPVAIFY